MRITDASFSPGEAALIRQQMIIPGAEMQCPRCSLPLATDDSCAQRGAVAVICRLIRCVACRRMITLNEHG